MSTISWQRLEGLQKVRGRFDEVLGGWIRGEDVEAFFKDPFEALQAQIISSGGGKVMMSQEGRGVVLQ